MGNFIFNCIQDKNLSVTKGKALGVKTFFIPTLGNCHSSSPNQGCVTLGSDGLFPQGKRVKRGLGSNELQAEGKFTFL